MINANDQNHIWLAGLSTPVVIADAFPHAWTFLQHLTPFIYYVKKKCAVYRIINNVSFQNQATTINENSNDEWNLGRTLPGCLILGSPDEWQSCNLIFLQRGTSFKIKTRESF